MTSKYRHLNEKDRIFLRVMLERHYSKNKIAEILDVHQTIYRYIYSDYGIRNMFYEKLRRKHFWRVKRNARKPRVPKDLLINNRPAMINTREEFGHWEVRCSALPSHQFCFYHQQFLGVHLSFFDFVLLIFVRCQNVFYI